MTEHFDFLDSMPDADRQQQWFANLPNALQQATNHCPGLAKHLQGHDIKTIFSARALTTLPVLRKSAIIDAQNNKPPFGGFVNENNLAGCRVFMSPGPVWELQANGSDPWQAARALHAAGLRSGDRVHNTFSYHNTPGGFMLDEGARELGCTVYPAGVGNTSQQLDAIAHMNSNVFIGTPDYLQILFDKAAEEGRSISSIKTAMVSGGALFPAMRAAYLEAGVHVQQCYATADLGVIAYETASGGEIHGGMLLNENLYLEIVRPGTGELVAGDEVGEMVVTRFNPEYPLVRFATGDMSAWLDEPSPCGRSQRRIKGWMGRADQRTKVRGMFVDPIQIQAVRRRHKAILQLRMVVGRANDRDTLQLQVYLDPAVSGKPSADELAETVKECCGLYAEISFLDTVLPADGIVVDDTRTYNA
ncbi:MAG: AMP-binding protein [Granulosicoccaceae bacterium]